MPPALGETKRVLICYDRILAAGLLITVVDGENPHLTSSILLASGLHPDLAP